MKRAQGDQHFSSPRSSVCYSARKAESQLLATPPPPRERPYGRVSLGCEASVAPVLPQRGAALLRRRGPAVAPPGRGWNRSRAPCPMQSSELPTSAGGAGGRLYGKHLHRQPGSSSGRLWPTPPRAAPPRIQKQIEAPFEVTDELCEAHPSERRR